MIEVHGGSSKGHKGGKGKKGKAAREETADIIIKDDEPELVSLPGGKKKNAEDVVLVDGKPIGVEEDATPLTKKHSRLYVDDAVEEVVAPAEGEPLPDAPSEEVKEQKKFKRH